MTISLPTQISVLNTAVATSAPYSVCFLRLAIHTILFDTLVLFKVLYKNLVTQRVVREEN